MLLRTVLALVLSVVAVFLVATNLNAGVGHGCVDTDSDGWCEDFYGGWDNCIGVYNPDNTDADMDGYGDACDFDTNNDCSISVADLTGIISNMGQVEPPISPYDLNGDGVTTVADITLLIPKVGSSLPPGLGLRCASCGNGEPTGIGAMGACPGWF